MPGVVAAAVAAVSAASTALTAAFVAMGASQVVAGTLASLTLRIGGSLLLNVAASALTARRVQAQDLARELSLPTTEPSWRFVYGEARATGTPVGTPIRGEQMWGCWLLNSRASELGSFTLLLDKREVAFTGDPFDFAGEGAVASAHPFAGHCRFWIGRGDQLGPPQMVLDQAPWAAGADEDLWKPSDAWRGRTVLWARLSAGGSGERAERWPSAPPLVEVEGRFSTIWDPRDAAQDPDDPASWGWSDNHALCLLDAAMRNPMRGYRAGNLHLPSFIRAADAADEAVPLSSGGSERRYRLAGTLTFGDGELEDLLAPMALSGAGDLVRIGGRLGLAAGEWRAPQVTVSDFLGDGIEAADLAPEADLINEMRVSYLSPARGFETAALRPWPIPGALAADGGVPATGSLDLPFCPSPWQAMRVRKILGLRLRRQERLSAVLPPEAFDLVGGATLRLAIDHPVFAAFDGIYEVESIHPGLDPVGAGGEVAMRLPASLVRHDPAIYAWDPAVDEEEVADASWDGTRAGVQLPGEIAVTTGATVNLDTGGTVIPRIRFAFAPSLSDGVARYDWQFRPDGGDWETGGTIVEGVADGAGQVFGHLTGEAGRLYDIRVRAGTDEGASGWRMITGVTPVVDLVLAPPTDGAAAEVTPGTIEIRFRLPNDPAVQAIEIWAGATASVGDAAPLTAPIYGSQNATVIVEEPGVGPGVTRHYFARARGPYAAASAFTGGVTATTATGDLT